MVNPYTKTFGKKPLETIPRSRITGKVTDEFNSENPESPIYILSGVRGAGKTVTMTEIMDEFRKDSAWICVEINSSSENMLKNLAAQLYAHKPVFDIVSRAKINLSFLGFGVEVVGEPPITDYATAVARILEQLKKQNKKVLITIDEIIVSEPIKELIKQFQIYIRNELPVFMIVTGIYKTIEDMKNQPGMTFLYRAPRIPVEGLDRIAIANSYEKNLSIPRSEAIAMSKITCGYSFGFQVLGYLCFDEKKAYKEILDKFDHEMYEKVYGKVWSETSPVEKKCLNAIATSTTSKVKDIREILGMDSNHFNPYRQRLITQGLVTSPSDGYLKLTLPRFGDFVREQYLMDDL